MYKVKRTYKYSNGYIVVEEFLVGVSMTAFNNDKRVLASQLENKEILANNILLNYKVQNLKSKCVFIELVDEKTEVFEKDKYFLFRKSSWGTIEGLSSLCRGSHFRAFVLYCNYRSLCLSDFKNIVRRIDVDEF